MVKMSAKDIKELAGMAVIQCREKLISLIKEYGDYTNVETDLSKLSTDELYEIIKNL